MPAQKRERYMSLGLSEYDASVIVEQMASALFFDKVLELGADAKSAVNFMMGPIAAHLKEEHIEISDTKLTPENLAELLGMIEKNTISNNVGKQIIVDMMNNGTSAKKIVEEKGLSQITDVNAIRKIVEEIVANNQPQVEQYKSGKTNLFGFFVGQAMKATKGKANPKTVNEILRELLDS